MANVCFSNDADAGDFACDNCFRYGKVSGNKSGCFVKSGIVGIDRDSLTSGTSNTIQNKQVDEQSNLKGQLTNLTYQSIFLHS